MPGDNFAVFGCGSNRRTKGLGIFKLPATTKDDRRRRRRDLLNEITKSRVVDKAFKEKIEKDSVYICEKHFQSADIEICKWSSSYWSCRAKGLQFQTVLLGHTKITALTHRLFFLSFAFNMLWTLKTNAHVSKRSKPTFLYTFFFYQNTTNFV